MKCSVCSAKLEETFLKKIVGTQMVVEGRKKYICPDCQSKLKTKEEIIKNLK